MHYLSFVDVDKAVKKGIYHLNQKKPDIAVPILEAALEEMFLLKGDCEQKSFIHTVKNAEEALRKAYIMELIDSLGLKKPEEFADMFEQKNHPLLENYLERNRRLDEKIIQLTLPSVSDYVM